MDQTIVAPDLTEYISIDNLLVGYKKEPLISIRYSGMGAKDEEIILTSHISKINATIKLDGLSGFLLEELLGEGVRNILQHCDGTGDVRVYSAEDNRSLISLFELNEYSQFLQPGHTAYLENLRTIYNNAISNRFGKQLEDFILDEDDCLPNEFALGTTMIIRNPDVKKVGIADIDGRAYFFFEYRLHNPLAK